MILIAYDGSADCDHVISVAGSLLSGGRACVLYAWDPLSEPLSVSFDREADNRAMARQKARAHEIAETGAVLARLNGFEAEATMVCSADPAVALEEAAARLRPELLVLGGGRLSGLRALVKGSVARSVERHVRVPMMIVPATRPEPTADA